MKHLSVFALSLLFMLFSLEGKAHKDSSTLKWLIEPVKISSLMVNTHPEYNGWGFEVGRRITDKLWFTSMIEKTQGSDFKKYFDPNFDYLISFDYFAWLNTFRYYLKPDAKYTTFFDAGIEFQGVTHKFLRNGSVIEQNANAFGPIVFIGGEWRFHEFIYFKWRSGGFLNVIRNGSFTERINDGQDQLPFYLYPHLSDAAIGAGTYAGDVAFGIRF